MTQETTRPEWVTCVADTRADHKGFAWCGRPIRGFSFADAEHAAQNGRNEGRLTVCPGCRDRLICALRHGDGSDE